MPDQIPGKFCFWLTGRRGPALWQVTQLGGVLEHFVERQLDSSRAQLMPRQEALNKGLALIFSGIEHLKQAYPHRNFTIDGRLVGDIGEVIAGLDYAITLDEISCPHHDATTITNDRVQIKATFKDSLTFKIPVGYYLGFKLFADGRYEEVFNGPSKIIYERYKHRQGIGIELLSFPIAELKVLSRQVSPTERIPKRER